jgi:predicted nucleotidyltransferase
MNLSGHNKLMLQQFFAGKPVKKAYVFGSYARNEADKNSDMDLLVELDHSQPIGMRFFTYQPELEKLLKMKVDLVSNEGLSKHIKPIIDKEKILIYERRND